MTVFARRGLGAARHAEVAALAGVSVPTVFVYFPSRPDLVDAVLDEVGRFYAELAQRIHASREPAPLVLQAHVDSFAASIDSHPDYTRVWLSWSSAVRDELWPRYQILENAVAEVIARTLARGQREGTIARDVHPDDGALIAIGAAHLIAQMKFSGRSQARMERFRNAVVRSLAGGLARAATGTSSAA